VSDSLFELLHSCTVRLQAPGGHGTGFFVAPGLILTCAHVVEGARGDETHITAHYSEENYQVQEIVEYLSKPYPDLALLRIDLREHPCVYLDESITPRDVLYTYGYTEEHREGESTTLDCEGKMLTDNGESLVKLKAGQVRRGSSGSPLLNERTWGVCGVIKLSRHPLTDLGGGAIPTEVVLLEMPELIALQETFHRRDSRWMEARDRQRGLQVAPVAPQGKLETTFYEKADKVYKPEQLFGRYDLLFKVVALLDEAKRVLLFGFGGVGKTALAATIADQRIDAGKGTVIWMRLGAEKAEAIFDSLVQRLAKEKEKSELGHLTGDPKILAVKNLLAQFEATLLVLDDVWNGQALYRVLKAVPDGMPVLVTSRQRFPKRLKLEPVDVGDLSPDEALRLLGYWAGEQDYSADEGAHKLCKELGYHPYALEIAGVTLEVDDLKPDALREQIADAPHDVSMPEDFAEEGRESVKKLLDRSFDALDAEERVVFRAFGALFAPGATSALLAVYMQREESAVTKPLNVLVRRSLAKRRRVKESNYYYVHALTFSYARTMFRDKGQDDQAMVTTVQRYVEECAQDFNRLDFDQANILGAAQVADDEARVSIIRILTLDGYFDKRGHTLNYLKLLDRVLKYLTARKDKGTLNADQLTILHYLLGKRGNAYFDRGDYVNASETYKAALGLAENNDRIVLLSGATGKALSFCGENDQARTYFDQGYGLARGMEDDFLLSFVLEQESHAAGHNEDYETAHRVAAEQVTINERLLETNRNTEILEALFFSLLNLGEAERRLTKQLNLEVVDPELAKQRLQKALSIHQRTEQIAAEMDDALLKAWAVWSLAEDYHTLGERDKAWEYLSEARKLWHSRGVVSEEASVAEFMKEHGYDTMTEEKDNFEQ
jgi:tetratricopeptide (TPR) repeat protein